MIKEINIIGLVTDERFWKCVPTKIMDKMFPHVVHCGYELVFEPRLESLKDTLDDVSFDIVTENVVDAILSYFKGESTDIAYEDNGVPYVARCINDDLYKIVIPTDTSFRNYDYKKYFRVLKDKICEMCNEQTGERNLAPKKVFISQPFSDRTEEEVFQDRDRIVSFLKSVVGDIPLDIIDQYHQEAPDGVGRLFYLGNSIKMMETADFIIFSKDWEKSPGCRVERMIASEYKLDYVIEPKNIRKEVRWYE